MSLFSAIAGAALLPLTLVTLASAGGLFLLWRGRRKGGGLPIAAAALLLAALGTRTLPEALLRTLESEYPPLAPDGTAALPPVRWIVVLGGGHNPNPALPATSRISAPSLARLVEAMRLQRRLPSSRLFLTGGGGGMEGGSDAEVMREVAVALGVPAGIITVDSRSRDTEESAEAAARLAGHEECILVTSAWHMPRAAALFRRAGGTPIAAPVDYLIRSGPVTLRNFYPTVEGLEGSRIALHEYAGLLWSKLRGKI